MPKQTKPKCTGADSQSCGWTCISGKDTCREKIDKPVATKLVAIAKANQQLNNRSGEGFDSIYQEYPLSLLVKYNKSIRFVTTDLGEGFSLTSKTVPNVDGSDSVTFGYVTGPDKKLYTISDGLVKEVTGSRSDVNQEAFEAALRSKIETRAAPVSPAPVAPAASAKPVGVSPVLPKAADLDSARRKLVAEFGADVDKAEANVKKILASPDTQVFIRVSSQDNLLKMLTGGKMLTSAELNVTSHSVPDLMDSNYQTARNRVEQKVLGLPLNTAAADRPIYGYLGSVEGDNMTDRSHSDVQAFGSIQIKLKDSAKSRATFTGSDSFKSGYASEVLSPNAASLVSDTKFGYDIDDSAAPITNFARSAAKTKRGKAISTALDAKNVNDLNGLAPTGASYLETQIHGGVKDTDIAEINFTPKSLKDTPSHEVLSLAVSRGITVKIHGVEYKAADIKKDNAAINSDARVLEGGIRGKAVNMGGFGAAALSILDIADKVTAEGALQDTRLFALQEARGFTRKPKVVTEAELAAKLKEGGSFAVRGLKSSDSMSADDVAEATRTGDHYIGYGMHGNGMYVGHSGTFYDPNSKAKKKSSANSSSTSTLQYAPSSAKSDIKRAYEGPTGNGYINNSTADLRMHIPATAKVATQDQVIREMEQAAANWEAFASDPANKVSASDRDKVARLAFGATKGRIDVDSTSRFAVMSGYDAIALTLSYEPDNFMVILNHSMLSIADKSRDKSKGDY